MQKRGSATRIGTAYPRRIDIGRREQWFIPTLSARSWTGSRRRCRFERRGGNLLREMGLGVSVGGRDGRLRVKFADMPLHVICDLCERGMDLHASYIVRMDIFADPNIPPMSTEDLSAGSFDQTLDALMEQMKGMSADDLQDGVHRRLEYRLCPACQRRFLANPLGKPREVRAGTN